MPYAETFEAMCAFTLARERQTADEIWLTEHPPVYTLGLAGKREHILDAAAIPVLQSDRGGQVTYHGPGQVIAYLMIDLKRRDLKVRELVRLIEDALIATLRGFDVAGVRRAGMPGVYVESGAKIAALGLKVKNGCSYHGASLNVDMDLAPFRGINPCGYESLAVTQIKDFNPEMTPVAVAARLAAELTSALQEAA
jgi:lipoyl(octanoyl) transferase